MKKDRLPHRWLFCLLIALSALQMSHAQLTPITLQVSATAESCTANGSLSFVVGNPTPGATIIYSIFRQPNTTTPIASISAGQLGGLVAGNYVVVATQTLGSQTNSVTQNATITNTLANLSYQLSGMVNCSGGQLTVNILTGTPTQYEIISGPVIRPLQSSNVFTALPAGQYVVRVIDACGDGVVQTYTLQNPSAEFDLSAVSFPECILPNCNTITVSNTLSAMPGSTINFPLALVYTLYPPAGAAVVMTQTVASGNSFLMDLPFYHNQSYQYDLQVTDNCGNVTTELGNTINKKLEIILKQAVENCVANIEIEACNFVAPLTVQFLAAPAGFNPALFNSGHPGPFGVLPIAYESNQSDTMPTGNYTVQITDACGHTAQGSLQVDEVVEPKYTMLPQNCGFGQVGMPAQNGSPVASVIITSAPQAYNHPLPDDVSAYISGGQFVLGQLPAGTYTFTVVSVCLETYEYTVTIPQTTSNPVLVSYIKGCSLGYTSIKLGVQGAEATQVIIQNAPASLGQPLPYDVSANVYDGSLYMNGLPQGSYTIFLTDSCGGQRTFTLNAPGYAVTENLVAVDANCGSFDLVLDYSTNENAQHTYWLQKWNMFTNRWEHPYSGSGYVQGEEPDPINSLFLDNHQTNLNLAVTGNFRVLRFHKIYGNGTDVPAFCIETVKEFTFSGAPSITDAFALPCQNANGDIVVVANGLAPLQYYITTRNGQPFYVDNGNSTIFEALTPGIYNFQVRDTCGNIVNRLFDFESIPSLSIAQSVLCDGQTGQLMLPLFSFLNYQWWQGNDSATILSSSNTLEFSPFNAATDAGIYHVRISSNQAGLCADQVLTYTILSAGNAPQAGNDGSLSICGNSGVIDLFNLLGGTFSANGQWSETTGSGMLLGHSWLPIGTPYGTYEFKYTVFGLCGFTDEALVTIAYNPIPDAPQVPANLTGCSSENLQLSAIGPAGASYQWTGPNGFSSTAQNPVLDSATSAASGIYSVTAHIGDCTSAVSSTNVAVLPVPEFELQAGCNGNDYQIAAVGASFADDWQLDWSGPDGFTGSVNPLTVSGEAKGIYTLTATNASGCSVSHSIAVVNTLCAYPAGISPNGDSKNDTFDLTGFDVLEFKIYNRYGRMVFEQASYTNQWHGQDFNGRELPDATYYYYIRLNSGEEKTGWVYLIRKS